MKILTLVSGGIDSPVAAGLLAKQGAEIEIEIVHFCLYPFYCTGSFKLACAAFEKLAKISGVKKVIIVPWGKILSAASKTDKKHQCLMCRHSMYRAAEIIAKQERCKAMATGEALGQKASQTIQNLYADSAGIGIPILRPLIGLDKEEIISLSKELGLWSPMHSGCCTAVPEKPATRARPETVQALHKEASLEKIIKEQIKKAVKITDLKNADWDRALRDCIS